MTFILLIRHGSTDTLGKLMAGRMPGIHLNRQGKSEAEGITRRLKEIPLHAVFSSPLERTLETAETVAGAAGLQVRIEEALNEVEYGEWTGRSFEELGRLDQWHLFNTYRSGHAPPGGERMLEVQNRVTEFLLRVRREHPDRVVAAFRHGDVIRSALAYFAGIPIDSALRVRIDPASISIVSLHELGHEIRCVNETGRLSIK